MAINQRIKKVAMTICNVKMWWTAGAFGNVRRAGLRAAFPPEWPHGSHQEEACLTAALWWPMGTWLLTCCSQLHCLEAADRMTHQTPHRTHYNSNGMDTALDPDTRHTVEAEHPRSKNPNVPGSLWGPAWCWCCPWTTFDLPSKECRPQMLCKITFEYM